MKKKFLFVHSVEWGKVLANEADYMQNVSNWCRLFDNWQEQTCTKHWNDITFEFCQQFEYVMFFMLTDEKPDKYKKCIELLTHPGREYKTINYIDGCVGWQHNPFSVENKLLYLQQANASDFVFHYGIPESEGYWRSIIKDTNKERFIERAHPVEFAKKIHEIELPFPVDYVKLFGTDKQVDLIVLGKGIKNINEERNVFSSFYIARKLQEKYGWGVLVFAPNPLPPEQKDYYYWEICGLKNVVEVPVLNWRHYIRVLSLAKIGIHLDCLETRGQFALDCACLKIPIICSGSVAGRKLYPDTWLAHCRDLNRAEELAYRLMDDGKFRTKVVNKCFAGVDDYSFASTRRKLFGILGIKD